MGGASTCPYGVGDILQTKNSAPPSQRWWGTEWQAIDTFLLGVGSSHQLGETGGEETHTLTVDEMPSHSHVYRRPPLFNAEIDGRDIGLYGNYRSTPINNDTSTTGGNKPHNNMPPYTVIYIWERIK